MNFKSGNKWNDNLLGQNFPEENPIVHWRREKALQIFQKVYSTFAQKFSDLDCGISLKSAN